MRRPPSLDTSARAEAAVRFLLDLLLLVLLIVGGVWALLAYFEPRPAATLCTTVPLIRQPYMGRGPLWWQRLVLRVRLLRLGGRQRSAQQDVQMLRRDMAIHRALLDTASTDLEAHYHRNELLELGDLLDARINAAALADDEIDWARSDLGRLQ